MMLATLLQQAPKDLAGLPWSVIWAATMALGSIVVSAVILWMDDRNRRKYAPFHPLYDEHGNACWVTRKELDNVGAKFNRLEQAEARIDLRLGKMEHEAELLKQSFDLQQERMMEKITEAVGSLRAVTERLEVVSERQGAQAVLVETLLRSTTNRPRGGTK